MMVANSPAGKLDDEGSIKLKVTTECSLTSIIRLASNLRCFDEDSRDEKIN